MKDEDLLKIKEMAQNIIKIIQGEEPPTVKQLDYIEDLGGDRQKPQSKLEASDYIEELKK